VHGHCWKGFQSQRSKSRLCVYICVNARMVQAYISTVWRRSSRVSTCYQPRLLMMKMSNIRCWATGWTWKFTRHLTDDQKFKVQDFEATFDCPMPLCSHRFELQHVIWQLKQLVMHHDCPTSLLALVLCYLFIINKQH